MRTILRATKDHPDDPGDYIKAPFILSLEDEDFTHIHDDVGHAFPCTRKQLVVLRDQITTVLDLKAT